MRVGLAAQLTERAMALHYSSSSSIRSSNSKKLGI